MNRNIHGDDGGNDADACIDNQNQVVVDTTDVIDIETQSTPSELSYAQEEILDDSDDDDEHERELERERKLVTAIETLIPSKCIVV